MEMYKIVSEDISYYVVALNNFNAEYVLRSTLDIGIIDSIEELQSDFLLGNEDDSKVYAAQEWIEMNPEPAFIGWVE